MNWTCEECGASNDDEGESLQEGDIVFCKKCAETSIIVKTAMRIERQKLSFDGEGWDIEVGQVYSHPAEGYHIRIVQIVTDSINRNDAWIHYVPVSAQEHSKVIGDEARFRV